MKKLILPTLLAATGFTACTEGYEASHRDIFKDQIWTKGEVIEFNPDIKESGKTYQISADLQHIYGYAISGLDVKVSITAPSGAVELEKDYVIAFKDASGNSLSDCSGDYCDVIQVLEPAFQFRETGVYSIKVEQDSHAESVAGFLSLKLMIK